MMLPTIVVGSIMAVTSCYAIKHQKVQYEKYGACRKHHEAKPPYESEGQAACHDRCCSG